MVGAVGGFANQLRPLEQKLGPGVIMKRDEQPSKALQGGGNRQVIATEGTFQNVQSALEQWARGRRLARQCQLDAKIDQARGQTRIDRAKRPLFDCDGPLGDYSLALVADLG